MAHSQTDFVVWRFRVQIGLDLGLDDPGFESRRGKINYISYKSLDGPG